MKRPLYMDETGLRWQGMQNPDWFWTRQPAARSPWYETVEDIEAAIVRARQRERRLAWVRSNIFRLSLRQAQVLYLYLLTGASMAELGRMIGISRQNAVSTWHGGVRALARRARAQGLLTGGGG